MSERLGIAEAISIRVLGPTCRPVRQVLIMSSSYRNSSSSGYRNLTAVGTRTARPVGDRLAALESRWTALPNRARSVVGEHPGGLNDTGTDAGSVHNAELGWQRTTAG